MQGTHYESLAEFTVTEDPSQTSSPTTAHDDSSFNQALTAAQNGSAQAFEQLYRGLATRVFNFARTRRAYDPEGVVNEVFLRVFTKIDTFSGTEPQFNAWVFTIARNQLIDQARRSSRRPVERFESDPDDGHVASGDVEDEALVAIGTDELIAQLDVLTADQRDVVLLRIVADLTIDAIAETLGKQPGAVKALQRRAFRTLAKHLNDPLGGVTL